MDLKQLKQTYLCFESTKITVPMAKRNTQDRAKQLFPASILYKSIPGRYRPVSYPDGPITARYRCIKNAYWVPAFHEDPDRPANALHDNRTQHGCYRCTQAK